MKASVFKLATVASALPAFATVQFTEASVVKPLFLLIGSIAGGFCGYYCRYFFETILSFNLQIGAASKQNLERVFGAAALFVYFSSLFFCFRFVFNVFLKGALSLDIVVGVFGLAFVFREIRTQWFKQECD